MYDLQFEAEDLAANRMGDLTDAQRKRLDALIDLQSQNARGMVIFFAVLLLFIFVVGGIIEFNNAGQNLERFLSRQNLLAAGFVLAFFIFAGVLNVIFHRSALNILREGEIRMTEGHAKTQTGYVRGTPYYQVTLRRGMMGGKVFRFTSESSLRYFENDALYRVYYVPYSLDVALSAERLDE